MPFPASQPLSWLSTFSICCEHLTKHDIVTGNTLYGYHPPPVD